MASAERTIKRRKEKAGPSEFGMTIQIKGKNKSANQAIGAPVFADPI
jgi:hypothetical protein